MSAEDVVKSVARKLKYYFEVKRLEDGFDLCDLHQLALKHSSPKTQPAHKHDGLHHRALKQYFSESEIRFMLSQQNSYDARGALQGWREIEVRKMLDNNMKLYNFQGKTLPSSYYYHSLRQKSRSPGVLLHGRKQKQNNLLRSWPVKRTISDQHITKDEAERLVNSATKIICRSEFSFPDKTYARKHGGPMCASLLSQNELSRPTTARSGSTLQYRDLEQKKGRKFRSPRTQKRQTYKQRHSRSTSPAQSTRSSSTSSTSSTSSRTSSSYSHSSSSSVSPPRPVSHSHSSSHTPRHSPRKSKARAVNNMLGQKQHAELGIDRSTQTEEDANVINKASESKITNSDHLQGDGKDRVPCQYQVVVRTGDRLGSSTAAPVKLTLYGDKGRSEEFDLSKMSQRHKIPFQKGHEDLFLLPAVHVGQLRKIQIGHDRAQLNYAWFLENVAVYDMHARRVYQFPCGQWLSGQDTDKKTYRILQADSEREFTEAPDASVTKSTHKQRNDSGPDMSLKAAHRSRPQDEGQNSSAAISNNVHVEQNSSAAISNNVHVESDSARFRESGTTQRGKKDDYEPKAIRFILRSVTDSKIVDEIILENDSNMDTGTKPGNDTMQSYKSPASQSDLRNEKKKEIERKPQKNMSIHAAVRVGDLDGVKSLLQQFPELKDQKDENGWTPLLMAASSGNMEILRWLITSGADVAARTPKEFNAIHVAALNGHVNIMVVLQSRGASILSCTKEKQTALHLAAKSGHLECVKWLVANGAHLDAQDTSGQTPFRLAETHRHDSCADFLRVCMQQLGNPKSTFAQIHTKQASGDLQRRMKPTVSASSKSHDDSSHDEKDESMSDSDNESRSEKGSDLHKNDKKKTDISAD
ncbi:hypothetical protein BsWGS_21097 [Bradybaena similaris]